MTASSAHELAPLRTAATSLSYLAENLIGSEILKISAEIRARSAAGAAICNLTVGDFSAREFAIPPLLADGVAEALRAGETNYPPSDGVLELRQQLISFYRERLRLSYPLESFLIAGGSRPLIYAIYMAIVDPGEKVLYPTPSWNNNHYAFLSRAERVEVTCGPETNFLPTADMIARRISGVRLLAINTPLNPTGTVLTRSEVEKIARLVVDENRRRAVAGERALYLMWDQVYWMLTFGMEHHTPTELVPEAAEWTIYVDGISKAFAATGLRVGWAAGPPVVIGSMRDVLGHVGAWAPRPEQIATAGLLRNGEAVEQACSEMTGKLRSRLVMLHERFQGMRAEGLLVDSVPPQGAIYLSARFELIGHEVAGRSIRTNEDIRRLLLEEAGFAVVPFQAFGLSEENGWMRLSVGAASEDEMRLGLDRVQALLSSRI